MKLLRNLIKSLLHQFYQVDIFLNKFLHIIKLDIILIYCLKKMFHSLRLIPNEFFQQINKEEVF